MTALEEKQRNATRRPDANISSPVIASGETFVHVTDQISADPPAPARNPKTVVPNLRPGNAARFRVHVLGDLSDWEGHRNPGE